MEPEGILPHSLGLQRIHHRSHYSVHVRHHCMVGLAVVFVVTDRRGSDEVELVERCVGHLEGLVHNVRRVAEEERVILVGSIVRVDDFEHPRLELELFVDFFRANHPALLLPLASAGSVVPIRWPVSGFVVWSRPRPRGAPCFVVHVDKAAHFFGPVVVVVMKVAKARVVSAALRGMIDRGHPCIPLTNLMCRVASFLHLGRNAGHVSRDGSEARHRITWVPHVRGKIDHVDVHRKPPRLQRASSGAAEFEGVGLIELDSFLDQGVHSGGLHLGVPPRAMPPRVRPSEIVGKVHHDVRLDAGRRFQQSRRTGRHRRRQHRCLHAPHGELAATGNGANNTRILYFWVENSQLLEIWLRGILSLFLPLQRTSILVFKEYSSDTTSKYEFGSFYWKRLKK
eukprot:m.23558 g.23558  ORF g.23558 m.23558 type:complete len:397 (+) comp5967_c0_seq1:1059-2249(+)